MSLVSAEMGDAVGLSHLYPVVPIMNFLSMLSLLLIVPRFWKTRIVALVSIVGWIFIGNLTSFLGMIHWRGHTNDALVWASILAVLGNTWSCGFFASMACFAHFTCQRLQPLSARHLYDTRRRDNLIHFFLTLILPVLWAPLYLFSCPYRYTLIEDVGPITFTRRDWPGFVVLLPVTLGYATVGIFSVLALIRYWHAKLEDVESDSLKHHLSVRTRKLLLMAAVNILLAGYGIYNRITALRFEWVSPTSLTENISSLQLVFTVTRSDLDTSYESTGSVRARTAISSPLLGFYVFVWFGCGAEARKAYGDGLLKLARLVGVVGTLPFSWSAIALRKAKPHQGLLDPLPLIQPYAPHITPYLSNVSQEHRPQPPASPARICPSDRVGNAVNNKRRPPPRDTTRRLSTHKPPFVPLNSANAATELEVSTRRLSSHKPPLIPLDPTNTTSNSMAPVPPPSARRLSYHKPAFRPLDPDNPIPNTRLQEEFAPRSRAQRLSYHKPPFSPFVPASVNTRGARPDALGTSIPLAEVQRGPESSGATGLPATGTVDALPPALPTSSTSMPLTPPPSRPPTYLAPPTLSSRSTSTAPSSVLSEGTPTPAPPYQDMNAFFGRAT